MTAAEVRALFDALGVNQTQAAEMLEVDARTVRRWERDGVQPGPARVALRLMLQAPQRKRRE